MLGRETVVHRHYRAACCAHYAGTERILGIQRAQHHPAAVEPDEDGRVLHAGVDDADPERAEVETASAEKERTSSYSWVRETGSGGALPATLFIACREGSHGSWWIMGTLARFAL